MVLTPRHKLLLGCALVLLTLFLALPPILERSLHLETYRQQIIDTLQQQTGRSVSYGKGSFTLRPFPSFTFEDVVVKDRDGRHVQFRARQVAFDLALLPLLQKKIDLERLHLEQPELQLRRASDGSLDIDDLLQPRQGGQSIDLRRITVHDGRVHFADAAVAKPALVTDLEDIDLNLGKPGRGVNSKIRLEAKLRDQAGSHPLSINGRYRLPAVGEPIGKSQFDGRVQLHQLDLAAYWPYYRQYVPMQRLTGRLDLEAKGKGTAERFTLETTISGSKLLVDYPQVFHAVVQPQKVSCKVTLEREPDRVELSRIECSVDGLEAKGKFAIDGLKGDDPHLTVKASSNRFTLEPLRSFIPYGIIAKDTADFIELHVTGGRFKLEEFRLDGTLSQLLHMDRGNNYNILFMKTTVEQGYLTFGPKVPAFNDLKGTLLLQGKDFILVDMHGKFGGSTFSGDGRITDYCFETPSAYPFKMRILPRQAEVAWLLQVNNSARPFGFLGDAPLELTGSGYTRGYQLQGDWQLTPAAYTYGDLINKTVGRQNRIVFNALINKEELAFPSLRCELAPLALLCSGSYRFADGRLKYRLETNRVPLQDLAPLVPTLQKHRPGGGLQATLQGESGGAAPASLAGSCTVNNVSLLLNERVRPLSALTGTLQFSGNGVQSGNLFGRLGSTPLTLSGSLGNFTDPSISITFSAPFLNTSDIGLNTPKGNLVLQQVSGSVTYGNDNLQINRLSASYQQSTATLKGSVQRLSRSPRLDLTLTAPRLESADLLVLSELRIPPAKQGAEAPALGQVNLDLQVDAATLGNVPLQQLKSRLSYTGQLLYVHDLQARAFDGTIKGSGRIDFAIDPGPRYQVKFAMDKLDAGQVTDLLETRREVSGVFSFSGDLTARGKTAAELKASALGNVRVNAERGTLNRFPTLAKVCSLLNVSQLFEFQLPDLVENGMPYNSLQGSFALQNGIATTKDLYLSSNAASVSFIGSLNLVKNEVDLTIGVKPLQTVDKVVSRIPVFGWLLTGSNRSLVVVYFEAKGPANNPRVEAVPAKVLNKGVLGIFTRTLQLPAKLFTDTGQVLFGGDGNEE